MSLVSSGTRERSVIQRYAYYGGVGRFICNIFRLMDVESHIK